MQDVYIVSAVRTAVGKAKRALAACRPEELGAAVIMEAVRRAGIAPDQVQDIVLGCAFPEGEQGMNVARITAFAAGMPATVPAMTVNRWCSSGLESIAIVAAKIRAGLLDIAVAAGVESMSMLPMERCRFAPHPRLTVEYPDVYLSMGNCGDNVGRDFNITRQEADAWAFGSVQKAIAAIDGGRFKDQIVPVDVPGPGGPCRFDTDEGVRRDTTLEGLAKLRPAFASSPRRGVCTAGNSSQVSDGAAAVCLMSSRALERSGATPLARFQSYAVAADSPRYLGPAQLKAVRDACELARVGLGDVGLIENNEAFATQCLFVVRELGLDAARVNVNGGAIAMGHPLGCTGSKLTAQLLYEMKARGERYGLVTMCIGGGQGAAGVFELFAA